MSQSRDRCFAIPIALTPLVGRQREIAAVHSLLFQDATRLLTLTGPGGVGKTRIATRVAGDVVESGSLAVAFVPLSAITDPDLVFPSMAQAVGISEQAEQTVDTVLAESIGSRPLLMVLDNLEQVISVAPRFAWLLGKCPGLKLLVTSRESLRIGGEQEFPVPPLALPAMDHPAEPAALKSIEAIALFEQRAKSVNPEFALTTEFAPLVVEVCRQLDGLPLAIELAAARLKVMSVADLLARMGQRLPFLSRDGRDVPDRLRTMRQAIAWSYDLLNADEQRAFRRLAVFSGGCTLVAAEHVVGDPEVMSVAILDVMTSLVDKSLLRMVEGRDGPSRYVMLETIREFGLEQLRTAGEERITRERKATWFAALAVEGEQGIWGPQQRKWLTVFEHEHDNARAILTWALANEEAELAQHLVGSLARFWWFRGHFREGRAWAERSLTIGNVTSPLARAAALSAAGRLATAQGDDQRAIQALTESLSICREFGNPSLTALTLWRLGMAAEDQGSYDQATRYLEESYATYRALGEDLLAASAQHALGVVAYEQDDLERAESLFTEALQHFRTFDHPWMIGFALASLGKIARAQGDFARAAGLYAECLTLRWERTGDKVGIAGSLRGLASIAALRDDFVRAARLYGAAETVREGIAASVPRHRSISTHARDRARANLGADRFLAAWEAGRLLSLEDAVAEALLVREDAARRHEGKRPGAHGLTPRELEVLQLLRDGYSNRMIGERLFISERTAGAHVQNILNKLRTPTRAAAAAYAIEHRLLERQSELHD